MTTVYKIVAIKPRGRKVSAVVHDTPIEVVYHKGRQVKRALCFDTLDHAAAWRRIASETSKYPLELWKAHAEMTTPCPGVWYYNRPLQIMDFINTGAGPFGPVPAPEGTMHCLRVTLVEQM